MKDRKIIQVWESRAGIGAQYQLGAELGQARVIKIASVDAIPKRVHVYLNTGELFDLPYDSCVMRWSVVGAE